jgi:2-oxoglutarate dehydrogenase E2 component (dihydrolipoamide succinyltransferase)
MATEIVVPELGESVVEATVAQWLKKEGESVRPGEALVELETDKVNLEVGAERPGVLTRIERHEGEDVNIGDVLGILEEGEDVEKEPEEAKAPKADAGTAGKKKATAAEPEEETAEAEEPVARKTDEHPKEAGEAEEHREQRATPVARRMAEELGIDLTRVTSSTPGGRVTKHDVETFLEERKKAPEAPKVTAPPREPAPGAAPSYRREERVRMSRRRQTIARRLVESLHNSAMLTTFNEIDMSGVMEIRRRRKEVFKERYGVGLGIVSFFVKASIGALREFPRFNAELQESEIVLKRYYDIGVAIGAEEGLVVPVLRDADRMSFGEIERRIKDFARKADEGTLSLEELRGGTFTVTNGGVFGSMLSTPILNPPQVGILGLHKIEERPIAMNGRVVIRPMMYVALSYDHRIVDGRESVQFLVRIKELIEDPEALLLEG